jgi:isoquinoline 1-oxidoreductase alpha subunit
MKFKININNKVKEVDVDADTPLLWVIRDHLKLTGTKFGCGVASCGACTVKINGTARRSCITPISTVRDAKVTTIEGLDSGISKAVQAAWQEMNVPQCGYCQSGQIISAVSLLEKKPKPTDADVKQAMKGNVCRCGTYGRIKQAILKASKKIKV